MLNRCKSPEIEVTFLEDDNVAIEDCGKKRNKKNQH